MAPFCSVHVVQCINMNNTHRAVVVLLLVIVGGLVWFGLKSESTTVPAEVSFINNETGESVVARFNTTDNTVILTGQGYTDLVLTQAVSASGARYVHEGENVVFWNKGNEVTVYKNDVAVFSGSTDAMIEEDTTSSFDAHVWVWQETRTTAEEPSMPAQPGAFTLNFNNAEGTVYGTTDCNNFRGGYSATDGHISFTDFASTLMYCDGSQEQTFTQTLARMNEYIATDSGELLLVATDGTTMIFTKQ